MGSSANFSSKRFAEDVAIAVSEYCADGMEALERCLKGAPMLEPQYTKQIQQSFEHLGNDLLESMGSHLSLFEPLCSSTIFSSPSDMAWGQLHNNAAPSPAMARTPGKSEAELDAELEALRSELRKAGEEFADLQADMARMDQDVRCNGHIVSHTAAYVNTLRQPRVSGDGNVDGSSDGSAVAPGMAAIVALIAESVRKLQPLLAKACALHEWRVSSAAQIDPSVAVELKTSQLAKMWGTADDVAALQDALGCGKDTMSA